MHIRRLENSLFTVWPATEKVSYTDLFGWTMDVNCSLVDYAVLHLFPFYNITPASTCKKDRKDPEIGVYITSLLYDRIMDTIL